MKATDILPKMLKLKKFTKYAYINRREVMAISLPTNPYYSTHINNRLLKAFKEKGVRYVNVFTDPENEAIALEPTRSQEGYTIVNNGSGGQIAARLRSVLPHGRYAHDETLSSKNRLVFRREIISFKGMGGDDGKDKAATP